MAKSKKKSTVAKAKSKAMSNREAGAIVQKLERASVIASGRKSTRLGSSRDPRGKNRLVSGPDGTGRLASTGRFINRAGVEQGVTIVGKRAGKRRAGAGGGGRSNG